MNDDEGLLDRGRFFLAACVNGWWGRAFSPPWSRSWLDPEDGKGKVVAAQLGLLTAWPPQEPTIAAASRLAGVPASTAGVWRQRDWTFRAVTDHIGDNLAEEARGDWEWRMRRYELGTGDHPKDALPPPEKRNVIQVLYPPFGSQRTED